MMCALVKIERRSIFQFFGVLDRRNAERRHIISKHSIKNVNIFYSILIGLLRHTFGSLTGGQRLLGPDDDSSTSQGGLGKILTVPLFHH